jgi:hypothetical protein
MSSLALISERRFRHICRNGDIKFLVLEKKFFTKRLSWQTAYLVAPLGRIGGGISKGYDPYLYSKWKIKDNVDFIVADAKSEEAIEHIVDLCKLFTDNHDALDDAKKLIRLKLKYREVMKSFLTKIKNDMEMKSINNTQKKGILNVDIALGEELKEVPADIKREISDYAKADSVKVCSWCRENIKSADEAYKLLSCRLFENCHKRHPDNEEFIETLIKSRSLP